MDICHALRSCGPQDQFFLRFNSGGGQVRSGNQIINALRECQGQTIGFIEHDCGSMATFLFLACSTWGVSDYAEWFSHTVSGGNYGKENETWESSQFLRKQTHKRIREEYKNFLTEDEIESILKGSDIYLNADEIMERLEGYSESFENEEEDFSEGVNLEEMIDTAVETGVQRALDNLLKKYSLVEREKPVKAARKKIEPKKSSVEEMETVN